LENIIRQAGHQEITVLLVGVNLRVAQVLGKLGVMPLVHEQNRHASRLAALQQATEILGLAPSPMLPELSKPPVLVCQS
ncbi:MAG: hypothetical protein U1D97_11605, partial [Desulfuromonadales bacterium]|nr:hypothetical protein [Desulfuromonadales bacterium]